MGVADRLTNPVTGNGDSGIPIAPGGIPRDSDPALYDTGVNPADTRNAQRASAAANFDSRSSYRDVRGNRVQLLTLAGFTAGEEFTVVIRTPDGGFVAGGTTYTHGTDLTAAALQADLRTRTGDAALTVTGTTDDGPFTITHFPTATLYRRGYPRYTLVSTQGTGVFTAVPDPEGDATIGALGESHRVSEADSILKPTIGTITVTPGVDEVQTVSFSAGTDGGAFTLALPQAGLTESTDWDFELDALKADVQGIYGRSPIGAASAPTVRWKTPLDMEINFVDWDTTDSAILTYDTTDASDALLFSTINALGTAALREAAIIAWVKTIDAFASGDLTCTETASKQEYDVVFHNGPRGLAVGDFVLAVTGTSNEDTSPDQNTAADAEAGVAFTFENGNLAGRPVTAIVIQASTLEDGGVLEAATVTETTAGVYGSASAAYTENGGGDSVLAAAINDTTGKSYGFVNDAATPVVFSSLPPGAYHAVLRTVEDGRVSKADNKAFTVTSA